MKCSIMPAAAITLLVSLTIAAATITAAPSYAATAQPEAGTSQGVVVLETEGSAGISVRIAEELTRVVNDVEAADITGNWFRIAAEYHGPQTYARDRCKDVLDYAKRQNLVPHIESWITYITTLYNEEFHLIARPEINSMHIGSRQPEGGCRRAWSRHRDYSGSAI
jgi:uncharacterized protein